MLNQTLNEMERWALESMKKVRAFSSLKRLHCSAHIGFNIAIN